jgi:hypothetical protein
MPMAVRTVCGLRFNSFAVRGAQPACEGVGELSLSSRGCEECPGGIDANDASNRRGRA